MFDATLIQKIPMKRWLQISRRYGVTLADLGKADEYATELTVITAHEVLRGQRGGADCWDEIEAMNLEQLGELLADVTEPDEAAQEADKSGPRMGTAEGPVLPGDPNPA